VIKLEADVIVAAAGLSGLAASVAAAELGAKSSHLKK
jgi:succinate dehydrogenase/fumarate reductase flavoprotein subunit